MNGYRQIREALQDLVGAAGDRVEPDAEDALEEALAVASSVLADTPEESEMERLRAWLAEGGTSGYLNIEDLLDHIQSKFLGGEDAEATGESS